MARELHDFVVRRIGDGDAEDVVGLVFEVVWRRWEDLPPGRDARRAWVFEATKRTMLDALKARRRYREKVDRFARMIEPSIQESPGEALADRDVVRDLLASLPAGQADAFRLTVIEGMTGREAAASLAISTTALSTRLQRARESLRNELATRRGGARHEST